ncbi:MAG: YlzJ-like family protein [Bacteroides sp.]|nr:YlzJ-like family protein [Bacteroides sp.]
MFYSIIGEYDVFFAGEYPEYTEKRFGNGIVTMVKRDGVYTPHSFFSTDPRDYLKKGENIPTVKF